MAKVGGITLFTVLAISLLIPDRLSGQTLAQGRVQLNYTNTASGAGCNPGPYSALFNIQVLAGFSDGNTWSQIVTNMMNSYKNGDSSPSASGPITGSVQLSGACTGTYTLDKTSNWYMQLDSKGWHFDFYWLDTAGPNIGDYNNFDAVTVDTQSVSGSVTQADIAQDRYLSGATVCISSSSTAACLTSLPLITTLGTTSVPAGSSGFTLTLTGSNFSSGARVNWTQNGQTTGLSTTVVNGTTISAQVPATLLTAPGTVEVTVVSASGQASAPQTFIITGAPKPTVVTKLISNTTGIVNNSCVQPPSVTSFTSSTPQIWLYFDVSAANIGDSTQINWVRPDGVLYETENTNVQYTSECFAYHIDVSGATAASYLGTWSVQVLWDGSPLFSLNFTISSSTGGTGIPTITGLSPSSTTAGGPSFTLTVNGTNFGSGAAVQWNGTNLATTLVSSTRLTATVPASLIAAAGTASIIVSSGGQTSASTPFTINAPSVSGTLSTYYFPHLAIGGGFQTTLTYVNYSQESVSCQTNFYADSGAALPVPFPGGPVSTRTDNLGPGAAIHVQTQAGATDPLSAGWAQAQCSGPVKASLLYRLYSGGVAQGEAGVSGSISPSTEFVTFAETRTGIAYANPSATPATVTITALNSTGVPLGTTSFVLQPNAHGAANIGPLLGLSAFSGSVQITGTVPIVSLALNFEASPVFSSLPPGDLPSGTPLFRVTSGGGNDVESIRIVPYQIYLPGFRVRRR